MVTALIQSLRPKQWTKNLLLFAGLLLSKHLHDYALVARAVEGFIVFCALSGVIYIFNDIADLKSDQAHPVKRKRPIASGRLPVSVAAVAALVICAGALTGAFLINRQFGYCSLVYLLLISGYSFHLKHVVILDLMILALGFVLRAIAGVLAIRMAGGPEIAMTSWFLACTFFLALFLATCKRRHELLLLADNAHSHRPVLEEYSSGFLDQMISVATAATVVSYALYTTSSHAIGAGRLSDGSSPMVYTLPFVVYGISRYLYLAYRRDKGGEPETVLLTDKWMIGNLILWLAAVLSILYG
ncbi:MAG: decaprenyl-phosphate phosphoribosyltransferase [Candidatus Sumerlaeota bacterium]|nr:decaprenyl-phosphate phosphoribosyltransferase [Candidatus Sumerlaeota bacterium]